MLTGGAENEGSFGTARELAGMVSDSTLLWRVHWPAGQGGIKRKRKKRKNMHSPVQHRDFGGCRLMLQVHPWVMQPKARAGSAALLPRLLRTPPSALWHQHCASAVLADLETLEINDQKKESICQIKALC